MVLLKWNQPVSVAMPAKSAWAILGVMGQRANRNRSKTMEQAAETAETPASPVRKR